ncbi:Structural maintenance of chromosomes protein 6, partial [Trichinella sp. T6]
MSASAEELTNYVNCNLSFGCIKRLRVRNFMCHKDIDLALGERINFIIGINGNIHVAVQENEFLVARK